jgi:SLT domain-containing protein
MTYQTRLQMADAMRLADSSNRDYWTGYKLGLQQAALGTRIAAGDQHHQWMTMAGDLERDARGHGYRDGYGGHTPDPDAWHSYGR